MHELAHRSPFEPHWPSPSKAHQPQHRPKYEGEVDFRWSGNGAEQYQKGESIDIWVSEVFECDNIEPIVGAVCRELSSYSDDMNYSRLPFRPNDIGHQWGEFQEGMKHGNRFFNESAKAFLDWLFEGLDG